MDLRNRAIEDNIDNTAADGRDASVCCNVGCNFSTHAAPVLILAARVLAPPSRAEPLPAKVQLRHQ
jgi:hypothetical protein